MKKINKSISHQVAEKNGKTNPAFELQEGEVVKAQDVEKVVPPKQEETDTDRQQWNNPIEFLLSCIAMSVGVGNFYRFPFTAYENGGGAFLIPYLCVLFFIGKPIYFMELSLGQFCSFGQIRCWKLNPIFKGVGYGSALASFCTVSYYNSLMAITLFYLFSSFRSELPWSKCDESWAGEGVCQNLTNSTESGESFEPTQRISLPQLFFENEVLKQKDSIEDGIGLPEWRLSLCLFAAWLLVFFSIVRGVRSSGKVAYFTAIYPYLVLFTFLIQGLFREGAIDGIKFFITPDWKKVLDPNVWFAAVGQCFFSLGTGFGPIIMYASYNPFRHNVHRDAMIVSIMDTLTSLLAGFTVFSILGGLAHELNVEISEVAKSGPSLIFVSYADAIAKFQWAPQLFAVLFFVMLLSLGIGSSVSWQMAVITVISDEFKQVSKFTITAVTCLACFLIGLIYVTPGGQWMLTLVDFFGGNFAIYILATLEIVGIMWIYGVRNISRDFEFMLEKKLNWYWKVTWSIIVPFMLFFVFVYSLIKYERLKYGGSDYPDIALVCGWLIAAACLSFVPLCALHTIFTRKEDTFFKKLVASFKPTKSWGPQNPAIRESWIQYKIYN